MRRLLLPTAVIAAAFVLDRGWLGGLPADTILVPASRGIFAVAFLLAWRFRRGRLAAAALVLALSAEGLRHAGATPRAALPAAVAVLLPLNLTLLGVLGQWRVLSLAGLAAAGTLALQGFAVTALADRPNLSSALQTAWVDLPVTVNLTQPALLAFTLAAAVLAFQLARRGTAVEAGLLGALAASFLAFELAPATLLYLTAGGLILILAQVENAFSLAFEDGLTGLPARRALEERLRHLGRRYAIAMVDIDHFKRLNDRHGHEVGDQVLRRVARRLDRVGGGGTAFRYGGEEFTILFPGKRSKEVESHLEELLDAISGRPFAVRGPARPKKKPRVKRGHGGGKRLKVTVSIGLADRGPKRLRAEQVMKAADRALYRAKRAGRNRLTVAG